MMHRERTQSTAEPVHVCVTVRVCAGTQREAVFTPATHGSPGRGGLETADEAVVRMCAKAFTGMGSGLHHALLTSVRGSLQRVRGESG